MSLTGKKTDTKTTQVGAETNEEREMMLGWEAGAK